MSAEFASLTVPLQHGPDDLVRCAVMTGIAQALALAGSSVSDAALIANVSTILSGADGVKGAILPADAAGRTRIVSNPGTSAAFVYPPTGATINDLAVTVADILRPGETKAYFFASATQVFTLGGAVGSVVAVERTFTETAGAGTYTGSVAVPAGATIHDIIVNGVALWTNAGAVSMIVGDVADDNGYFDAVNLKATDLLAGESISFALAGGKAGAYIANSQVSPRYSATARTISGIITAASTGGGAGRTRMTVIYSVNPNAIAATKV